MVTIFKMAEKLERWRLMVKLAVEIQRSIALAFSNIFALLFLATSLCFCKQHGSRAYLVK
jgi:hypothetical protein